MNRIIIIGNGFDRAHNLRTGYKEFIDDYWNDLTSKINNEVGNQHDLYTMIKPYSDKYVSLEEINIKNKEYMVLPPPLNMAFPKIMIDTMFPITSNESNPYNDFIKYLKKHNDKFPSHQLILKFKNKFFEHITGRSSLNNWLDIENEYYEELKKILLDVDLKSRNKKVKVLNDEWDAVKKLLEEHLTKVTENNNIEKIQSIQDAFSSPVELDDIATCKQHDFVNSVFAAIKYLGHMYIFEEIKNKSPLYRACNTDEEKRMLFIDNNTGKDDFKKTYCMPKTLLLNFNYTQTAENLYIRKGINFEIINIHGELNNDNNPIIFGYGDELDENYQKIEKTQDNDFLENIKSIKYHQTRNYRDLLKFIESGIYQVFVMGHSCGNSDRTLLNTLFEHKNCASIKVFYRQWENGTDDYSNLIRNISRNFNDKPKMRDIVVNRENCSALVPINEKAILEKQNNQIVSDSIRIQ